MTGCKMAEHELIKLNNKTKLNMEKKVYWLVSSNYDLSNHVPNFETAMELIKGDFDCQDEEGKKEVEYTIKPVWMTEDEYEALPEAT